jgi:hypothetical protein
MMDFFDHLCGLMIRVHGCRPRGPGFVSRRYQIYCVALSMERGPHNLVMVNEEVLERKVAALAWKTEINNRV